MGIFDEEKKKLAQEAGARARDDEQRKAQLRQIARKVSEDALSYVGSHPGKEDIEIGFQENVVTLQGKTSGKKLTITCEGRETYNVTTESGHTGAVDTSGMARTVLAWLD